MTSAWLPTVSPMVASSDTCGASSTAGRNRNMPSPPSTPAENVKVTFSDVSGEGENIACPIRFQIDGPACAAAVSTSSGKHLVAEHPAVGAVGQLDAKPVVVRGAADDGQHLALVGAINRAVGEARAGADGGGLGDHAHQRLIVGARGRRRQQDGEHGGHGQRADHGCEIHILMRVASGPSGSISLPPPWFLIPEGYSSSLLAATFEQLISSVTVM